VAKKSANTGLTMAPATLGTATVAAYVTSVFAAAFVLAPGGAPPRRGPSRVVFVPRETPRGLDIDTLTKWEADYVGGHVTRRPPRLGRECGSYRWTQDAEHVYVTIPLPGRPPSANDVSMVVSQEEFALDIIFPRREFTGVRGPLAGSVSVPKSRWEFADDPVDGPALEVTLEKTGPATDFVEWWGAFLLSETPAPVVQFKGIDAATGARFQQHLDTFDIELDVPRDVEPRDVRVDVDPTGWRVRVRRGGFDDDALFFEEDDEDVLLFEEDALPVEEEDDDDDDLEDDVVLDVGGDFIGRVDPSETSWLLEDVEEDAGGDDCEDDDTKALYITLTKQRRAKEKDAAENWWPGLTA